MGIVVTSFEIFMIAVLILGFIQIYAAMLIAEIQARVFVFFHVSGHHPVWLLFSIY
jgi:hypothetical protein